MKKCRGCSFSIDDMCMYFRKWKKDVSVKNCSEQLVKDAIQLKQYLTDYEKNKDKILKETCEALEKEFGVECQIVGTDILGER